MGYKERARYLELEHHNNIFDRSGNATSTILLDGRVIGIWDFIEKMEPVIKIFLFEKAEKSVLEKILLKAHEIGKFIVGEDVSVKECKSMVPLTQRTAGGVMSPLKNC